MLFQSWKTKYQCSESLHSQKNSVFFILIFFSQTITKVLLKYCALLSKIFPFYCEKEKIVSTAALIFWFWVPDWFEKKKTCMALSACTSCEEQINILNCQFLLSWIYFITVLSLFLSYLKLLIPFVYFVFFVIAQLLLRCWTSTRVIQQNNVNCSWNFF